MKKGQGMPLQLIVIAGICLIILVVLAVMFLGKASSFKKGVSTCDGTCETNRAKCLDSGGTPIPTDKCVDKNGMEKKVKGDTPLFCCLDT
jgi:hypothetical protein